MQIDFKILKPMSDERFLSADKISRLLSADKNRQTTMSDERHSVVCTWRIHQTRKTLRLRLFSLLLLRRRRRRQRRRNIWVRSWIMKTLAQNKRDFLSFDMQYAIAHAHMLDAQCPAGQSKSKLRHRCGLFCSDRPTNMVHSRNYCPKCLLQTRLHSEISCE